jgi:Methyltransferase domain
MNQNILALYPKERADLPEAYKAIYEQHYFANRGGEYKTTSLSQRLEGWMHKRVADDLTPGVQRTTLEIGAGTLNQLPYEPEVGPYDIVEPFRALYEQSPHRARIRNCFDDIREAKAHGPYDRITNIAVFEHIMDLPVVVAQAALLLKPQGTLRVAIPNEGTPLWKLGTMVTGHEFKKRYGLSYEVLMRYEHVNTASDIEGVLQIFFHTTRCKVFGLSKGLGFYRFYECSSPQVELARDYLQTRGISW